MNTLAEKFALGPNQFAILFETKRGIEADDLGNFLKRAATLARREGAELRVVRFEPGSLATIFEPVWKSKVAKKAKKEFMNAPIASSGVIAGIVGAMAAAFIWAFDTDEAGATPIARAGACVVEEKEVTAIKLVTVDDTVLLMDERTAQKVREIDRVREVSPKRLEYEKVYLLADKASGGSLEGAVVSADGELYFRPEGFRFLVPIDLDRTDPTVHLFPKAHFRVSGEIVMRDGRPDSIIVRSAKQI